MKTTIDIADALLEQARRLASSRRTTLRALVEEGLRTLLEQGGGRGNFRLRRATFKGSGLRGDIAGAGWDEVRKRAFEGRGG